MSAPKRDSKTAAKHAADDLAGLPVSKEMSEVGPKKNAVTPTPRYRPTADDLAGIPVSVEEMATKGPSQMGKKGRRR
ncbi:MAG TPA: hypothetical protein VE988_12865 [Gemmataceae bacterium]|nr:hypothetical protein [Gemmataceae bacterium]